MPVWVSAGFAGSLRRCVPVQASVIITFERQMGELGGQSTKTEMRNKGIAKARIPKNEIRNKRGEYRIAALRQAQGV